MTKHFMAVCLGFLMACGSSKPSSTTPGPGSATTGSDTAAAACQPTDCGAEPPISPSACPEGESISSACERAASGNCERQILCNGKPATEAAPPAAQP